MGGVDKLVMPQHGGIFVIDWEKLTLVDKIVVVVGFALVLAFSLGSLLGALLGPNTIKKILTLIAP
jgi:hypothetical protein